MNTVTTLLANGVGCAVMAGLVGIPVLDHYREAGRPRPGWVPLAMWAASATTVLAASLGGLALSGALLH